MSEQDDANRSQRRERRDQRLRALARYRYRMQCLKIHAPEQFAAVSSIQAALDRGETVDPKTLRRLHLRPEDERPEVSKSDMAWVLFSEWLAHPERPPIVGRWISWFACLLSSACRAYSAGREEGLAEAMRQLSVDRQKIRRQRGKTRNERDAVTS